MFSPIQNNFIQENFSAHRTQAHLNMGIGGDKGE
jgi:hypothetical protein